MWYKISMVPKGKYHWTGRLMIEYGRMILGYIYANSETAPDEEIEIYVNPKEWKWIVSSGDWTQTDGKIFDDAIMSVAKKVFDALVIEGEYKDPVIEHEAEMGSPGREWIHIRHDYFGDIPDDAEPGDQA